MEGGESEGNAPPDTDMEEPMEEDMEEDTELDMEEDAAAGRTPACSTQGKWSSTRGRRQAGNVQATGC